LLSVIGSVGSMIVGGIVAAVTILGLLHVQLNSSADSPVDVNNPVIDYGSTNN